MRIRNRERGTVLITATLISGVLATMTIAYVTVSKGQVDAVDSRQLDAQAERIASAGLNEAIYEINSGDDADGDGLGTIPETGFANGTYSVLATDNGDGTFTILAGGIYEGVNRAVEVVLEIEVQNRFVLSLFSDDHLDMNGNILADSYNSTLGDYASQAVNYNPIADVMYASDMGDIGSNAGIDINGDTDIMGNVTPGPGQTVSQNGSVYIDGSTAPASSPQVLDPVTIDWPAFNDNASVGVSGVDTYQQSGDGNATINAGTYHFSELKISGNGDILIDGDVVIYLDDGGMHVAGNGQIVLQPGATLTVYTSGSIHINGNSFVNTSQASPDVQIYSSYQSSNDTDWGLHINGNADFAGAVYMPEGAMKFNGNGDIYGSVIADTIDMNGNVNFHFDEALLNMNPEEGNSLYRQIAYRMYNPGN